MNIKRTVSAQGVRFHNRLYSSEALKILAGQRIELQLDGAAMGSVLVILGNSVIDVGICKRSNPRKSDSPPPDASGR